jgi:hypothetical protein
MLGLYFKFEDCTPELDSNGFIGVELEIFFKTN